MLVELSTVARMLFARREITKFPANVPLDTREMLGLHVIQVSFQADNNCLEKHGQELFKIV